MGNPSPRHTAEFKQEAVGPYGKSGTAYAEVARGPGCGAGSLSDWVGKANAAGSAPDANPFQMAEDPRGLKRENERLKRKNEMLLKASALFASRQLQAFPQRGRSPSPNPSTSPVGRCRRCARAPSAPRAKSGRPSVNRRWTWWGAGSRPAAPTWRGSRTSPT